MFTMAKPYVYTWQTYGLRFGNDNHLREVLTVSIINRKLQKLQILHYI
jgi:hypothetical protein